MGNFHRIQQCKKLNIGLKKWLSGSEHWLGFKGPGFDSQHPTEQLSTTHNSRIQGSNALFGFYRYQEYVWCIDIQAAKHHTENNFFNLKLTVE